MKPDLDNKPVRFSELEAKFGIENAEAILHTMEQFEGIQGVAVSKLTKEERMENVFRAMTENMLFQTRH